MSKLKKFILVITSVLLVILIGFISYGYYLTPKYNGEVALKSIQKPSTVYFDTYGVPHIYADSEEDAITTLGYVHAQDRLWQMELMRRIAPGRLAEIFGSTMLKNDIFFAGLGIDEASDKAIARLDKNSKSYILTMAYLDGINQYLEEGVTPIEYQLIGIEKKKFTVKDVYNVYGYMAFSFAMAQKSDPLITDIKNKFGAEYLKDLGIDGSLNTTQIKNFSGDQKEYAQISKSISSLLDKSPIPQFIGSNSWVIGEQKTKNKKVIFANDPHIGFSQPGVWYEAHLNAPNYEIYGYYLAVSPFPLLGHNRDYAYGLTMFENDDVDLFQEEDNPNNPNQYKSINGFQDYKVISKTIKVKDSLDVILKVKHTVNGPIMNGLLDGLKNNNPVSMHWIYTQQESNLLEAIYKLCHSKSLEDYKKAVSLIAAPGLNIMYGDAKGNIAWIASGKLYRLDQNVNPNFILKGSSKEDTHKEFLDFSNNPSAINPNWNYVYSANNQPEAKNGYTYPGYYLPEDRAKRIEQLLRPKDNWTINDVKSMINDVTSSTSPSIIKSILSDINQTKLSVNEKKALTILNNWKGTNNLNDVAPTIYNKFLYNYLKNTYKDELGEDSFKIFLSTHIMKQSIASQINNKNSPWWNNISTTNVTETRQDILTLTLKETVLNLEKQLGLDVNLWLWKKVHTVEHGHSLGSVAALRNYFNVGPFEINGANEVINNLIYELTEDGLYKVKAGPSTRRIIDFSDIENSVSILPTGQSGNPTSPHYNDQAEMYNSGKFRKMMLNKKEIQKSSTKLVFKPKSK